MKIFKPKDNQSFSCNSISIGVSTLSVFMRLSASPSFVASDPSMNIYKLKEFLQGS